MLAEQSVARKSRKHLTRAELGEVKVLLRDVLALPYKSHARGAAIEEICRTYQVSRHQIYGVLKHVRRSPASKAPEVPPTATVVSTIEVPVKSAGEYKVTLPGLTLVADNKEALIDVLRKIL